MARRRLARAIALLLVAFAALAAGSVSIAAAEAPVVSIESPANHSVGNNATPTFSGSTNEPAGTVTLNIYSGGSASGGPVQQVSVPSLLGTWSAQPTSALSDGEYTAQATEANLLAEVGVSNEVSFIVDRTAPNVSLDQPGSPTHNNRPTFTGGAGNEALDQNTVSVVVYAGAVGGNVAAQSNVNRTGGSWAFQPAGGLADGRYFVQASQADNAGNSSTTPAREVVIDTTPPALTIEGPPAFSNDTTPTLQGNAGNAQGDESVSVKIFREGSEIESTSVDGSSGHWSHTTGQLASGNYSAQATQRDSAGNQTTSQTVTFTIHTGAPNVSINGLPANTKNPRPTFSGNAGNGEGDLPSVEVRISSGGTLVSSASVERNGGSWSYTPASALPDGTYTATARQGNEDGESAETQPTPAFTVDTTPPSVSIEGPPTPSHNVTPTISGTDSDSGAVTVTVYRGATAGGTVAASENVSAGGGHWTYTPTLGEGEYTAQAKQTDAAGNTGTSPEAHFKISTAKPAVTMATVPTPSNDASPTLHGAAGTATGDHASVHVTIYAGPSIGGAVVASVDEASTTTWSYPAGPLSDGTYTALVTQANDDGETGEAHAMFTVDTTAPQVSVNQVPTPGNDVTPLIGGTAIAGGGNSSSVTVTVYRGALGGEVAAKATVSITGGNWTYEPTLAQGSFTVQASQSDEAGNKGASSGVAFVIDTTKPSVTIAHNIPPVSNDTTPTFSGARGTLEGDNAAVQVLVYKGETATGTPVESLAASVTGAAWQAQSAHLEDGPFTAVARQSDTAGNVGESDQLHFEIATGKPRVSLAGVASPSKSRVPQLTGEAGTAKGDAQEITLSIVGGSTNLNPKVKTTGDKWSYEPAPLADGTYTALAQQQNVDGETGESAKVVFTIDNVGPKVTIAAPKELLNDPTPTLTGATGTAEGDVAAVLVVIHRGAIGGPVAVEGKATVEAGTWKYTPATALSDGSYTVVASQEDAAHNRVTTSGVSFDLDTVAPKPTITTPANFSIQHTARPVFAGQATEEEGDVAEVTLIATPINGTQGSPQEVKVAVAKGAWNAEGLLGLAQGAYEVQVKQADEAGNVGVGPSVKITVVTFNVGLKSSGIINRGGRLVSGPSPGFSGAAETGEAFATTVSLNIYRGGAASGTPTTVPASVVNGKWSAGAITLPDGLYTVEAEQEKTGFGPGVSNAEVFEVDADAPALTLTEPANASSTNSTTEAVGGAAGSAAGDVPSVTVQLFSGAAVAGAPVQALTVPVVNGTWSAAISSLAPGTYTVHALQSDDVGNTAVTTPSTFTVLAQQPAAPTASFSVFPAKPHVGETVSLVSTSTGTGALSYAWSLSASGPFASGGAVKSASFSTAGKHVVRLQVTAANGAVSVATQTISVSAATLTLMQPFPIVRIAGSEASSGVSIRLLSVQVPVGAHVSIACHGPGCPRKTQSVIATRSSRSHASSVLINFRRFERSLKPGAVLEIKVFKAGQIGKYTRFTIRRGKLPKRIDTCLGPAGAKPIACPGS